MNTLNTIWGLLLDFFRICDMNCIYTNMTWKYFYVIVGSGSCV